MLVVVCLLAASLRSASAGELPIDLATPSGTVRGTLTLPDGSAAPPLVLIVAGSGPTDRDGNTLVAAGRNDSLKLLAAALAARGVASVRYDKRGIGQSASAAPAESALRFEDYVRDAESWLLQLSRDPRFSSVGILGHSEGALIATLAAQTVPVSMLVAVAGVSEAAPSVIRRQLAGQLPQELVRRNEAILSSLERGALVADVPMELMALYRPSVQPYLISWFKYRPTMELAKVDAPCLILQGDTDLQVDVSDARALGQSRPACEVHVVSGMNHILKLVPADRAEQIASYGDPSLPIAPGLVRTLVEFITTQTGH